MVRRCESVMSLRSRASSEVVNPDVVSAYYYRMDAIATKPMQRRGEV
jgi:hypothetical protein